LAGAVDQLLADRARAAELGRRALECAASSRGATARAVAVIREVAAGACPHFRPAITALVILGPISWIWREAGAWKRRRDLLRQGRLRAGVISVGNITMGGTGKTPVVLSLAEHMRRTGH